MKHQINKGMRPGMMAACIILLCILLCGCTQQVPLEELFKSEEYLLEYDMPPEYMSMNGRVDRVGQTYYLSTEHWIKFYEMDTHISGFLCNKPECTHDTDTCNANIGYCLRGIHIYNSYIYWIRQNRGSALWRMKPDGSEHEKVFDIEIDTSSISDYNFAMHRGYFYYYAINNRIKDGQDVSAFTMIRYPLDGSEHQKEIIYEEDYGYAFRCSVSFVRNKAYALIRYQHYTPEEIFLDNQVLVIDLQNLSKEMIQGSQTEEMSRILPSNEKLLVSSLYSHNNVFGTRINQYNFEKKEWVPGELFRFEDPYVFSGRTLLNGYWGEYVIIPTIDPRVRVFDWDGNKIFQKETQGRIERMALDENGFIAVENIFIDEGVDAGKDIIIFELISMYGETSTILAEMIE